MLWSFVRPATKSIEPSSFLILYFCLFLTKHKRHFSWFREDFPPRWKTRFLISSPSAVCVFLERTLDTQLYRSLCGEALKNCAFCTSEEDSKSKVCILQRSAPWVHAAISPWWFAYLWVLTTGIRSDASDVPLALQWDFTAVLPKIHNPVLRHGTKCCERRVQSWICCPSQAF